MFAVDVSTRYLVTQHNRITPRDVFSTPLFCIYIDGSLLQKLLGIVDHPITCLLFVLGLQKTGIGSRSFYVAGPVLGIQSLIMSSQQTVMIFYCHLPLVDNVKSADCNYILLSPTAC